MHLKVIDLLYDEMTPNYPDIPSRRLCTQFRLRCVEFVIGFDVKVVLPTMDFNFAKSLSRC